ncbi:hypothetical protein HDU93_004308 [Gonapodya sp. JEL0774]|nr:hypothetical protein HDU93_004308 [Gonapodya sp. JEL0774]
MKQKHLKMFPSQSGRGRHALQKAIASKPHAKQVGRSLSGNLPGGEEQRDITAKKPAKTPEPPLRVCSSRNRSNQQIALLESAGSVLGFQPGGDNGDLDKAPPLLLSIDIEAFERNSKLITELGWAFHCSRERRVVAGRHVVVRENAARRNGRWVEDNVLEYAFGQRTRFGDTASLDGETIRCPPADYSHPQSLPRVDSSTIDTLRERGTLILPLISALDLCIRDACTLAGVTVNGTLTLHNSASSLWASARPSSSTPSSSHGLTFTPSTSDLALRPVHLVGLDLKSDFKFLRNSGLDLSHLLAACPAFVAFQKKGYFVMPEEQLELAAPEIGAYTKSAASPPRPPQKRKRDENSDSGEFSESSPHDTDQTPCSTTKSETVPAATSGSTQQVIGATVKWKEQDLDAAVKRKEPDIEATVELEEQTTNKKKKKQKKKSQSAGGLRPLCGAMANLVLRSALMTRFDVSDLYCAARGVSAKNRVGLVRILQALKLHSSLPLHNAGNDAWATVDAFVGVMEAVRAGWEHEREATESDGFGDSIAVHLIRSEERTAQETENGSLDVTRRSSDNHDTTPQKRRKLKVLLHPPIDQLETMNGGKKAEEERESWGDLRNAGYAMGEGEVEEGNLDLDNDIASADEPQLPSSEVRKRLRHRESSKPMRVIQRSPSVTTQTLVAQTLVATQKPRKKKKQKARGSAEGSTQLADSSRHERDLPPEEVPVSKAEPEEYELVEEWRRRIGGVDLERDSVGATEESKTLQVEPSAIPLDHPATASSTIESDSSVDVANLRSLLALRDAEIRTLKDALFSVQLRVKQLEPDTDEDLEGSRDLDPEVAALFRDVIGMAKLKHAFQEFYSSAKLNVARRKLGITTGPIARPHMTFIGNPGTGKTKMARLVKALMQKVDLLPPNGKFLEVSRDDLVGPFVGQTEAKMKAAFEMAKDGIMFVDEAYRLTSASTSDYGRIALDAILTQMTLSTNSTTFIFAGYPENMSTFLASNPGLRSRIPYTFTFADYTPRELAAIFERQASTSGFDLAPDADRAWLAGEIARFGENRRRTGNGRLVEVLFSKTRVAMDARLNGLARTVGGSGGLAWDRRTLQTVERADVEEGIRKVEEETG